MFVKEALESLNDDLAKSGYTGTKDELLSLLLDAQNKTKLWEVYLNLENSYKDEKYINRENIKYIKELIGKLARKYTENSIHVSYGSLSLHFYGRKHSKNDSTYTVSLYIDDHSNSGINGYYGEKNARILYGYDDSRSEKNVCLIEKEPYTDD